MRKLFFVGLFLASLVCNTSTVLAKENGTEECDAMLLEKVLAQARGITASAAFLQEIRPTIEEVKVEVKKTIPDPSSGQDLVFERKEYDESVRRYFGRNSRPKPKND